MRGRRGLLGFLAGGALALLAGRWLAGQYADWAFHQALGFTELWRLKARTLGLLHGGTFVVAAIFAFVNFLAVRQSIVSLVLPSQIGGLEIPEEVPARRLTSLAFLLALLVAIAFALLPQDWTRAALAFEGVSFGEADPYLERDLGFYTTWLPFERALQARAMALTLGVGGLVLALYALTPSLRWGGRGLYVSTWVRRHAAALGALVVAIIGWGWRLDRFERLSPGSGVWLDATTDAVFSAFDHRVALPYRALAAFATLPLAVLLFYAGWRGYLRTAVTVLAALVLMGPAASALLPAIAKRPLSTAEARQRRRPYSNTAALYTRRAYAVETIERRDVARVPTTRVSRAIAVWDPAALLRLANDQRRDSTVALAWRAAPSGLEAFAVLQPLADRAETWHSERYLAAGVDDAGRPFHAPALGDGRLPQVSVYPGAARARLVADARGTLAAPAFETGTQRIALAWAEQDPRLLVREVPLPRPRLMLARDVRERLSRALPFLTIGPTLLPYVRGDSLYWIAEAFVTAARYPLSAGVTLDGREYRYVQRAATVVVQAQTGQLLVVPVDAPDPILRAWLTQAGSTFTPLAAAPAWLRDERPPAVDWMAVQGTALAVVGFADDSLGARRLTRPDDADADLAVGAPTFFAYDSAGALGWALPVDIPWAGRTLGILVARGGAEQRTEFLAYESSRWTTLLESLQEAADRAGFGRSMANARRGRVQAVPTADGPLWIQSYYDWPQDGTPRLAGVVVSWRGTVTAARSLPEALGERSPSARLDGDAFRERVARIYDAMQAAQRSGDWQAYGEAWAALGRLLQRP